MSYSCNRCGKNGEFNEFMYPIQCKRRSRFCGECWVMKRPDIDFCPCGCGKKVRTRDGKIRTHCITKCSNCKKLRRMKYTNDMTMYCSQCKPSVITHYHRWKDSPDDSDDYDWEYVD